MRISDYLLSVLFLLTAVAGSVLGQGPYTVTDLGPGWAYAINDLGQIAGCTSGQNATVYSGGIIQVLSGLPSCATSINNSGQVVGYYATTGVPPQGFLYSGGSLTNLPVGFSPTAINDLGQIVGQGSNGDAFLCSNGSMQDLGTPPGGLSSGPKAINDSGQVVGIAYMNSGYENAYLYSGGAMQSLGTLPGYTESQANAVNNDGQVVGVAYNGINDRAFIYSGDSMHDLGALGGDYSDAWGINDNGLVIGQAQTSGGNVDAFVYSDGVMQDLNNLIPFDPGWTLYEAYGINDEGLIVGEGFNPSGQQDAYLLTPVPEPSTRALLTAGAIIGLVGYGLRTRTVTRTAKPTALDQQDDSSILSSFPSHSSPVNVVRRAA